VKKGFKSTNQSAPKNLDFVKSQQQTVGRFLSLPFSGTMAALAFVLIVVLAIGGWLIYSQMRTYELSMSTGPKTGQAYAFGVALSKVVAEAEPKIRITMVESAGSVESMQWLQSGKIDLALGQTDADAGSQIRTVAYLYPELFHMAVRVDSGIEVPSDLKGKRVATPSIGSGSYNSFQFVMSHYGLKAEDVTVVPLPAADINGAFLRGEVDAVFRNLPLGETMTRELLSTGAAQLIAFDQIDAMRVPKPYMLGITIPKGTYRAINPTVPAEDLLTLGVQNVLYVNADLPDEIVRSITRVLFEHQNALVALNQQAAFISSPLDYEKMIGPALHPGAQAYYDREKPNFFQQYYNEITFLFMVAPLFGSAFLAVRAQMQAKQKKQVNTYQQKVIDLLVREAETRDLKGLQEIELELKMLLTQVMQDLDEGKFEMEDLQTFSFGWDKAIATVRHHQQVLAKQVE
jgi:TRAP transporter TAXI family solute receptor